MSWLSRLLAVMLLCLACPALADQQSGTVNLTVDASFVPLTTTPWHSAFSVLQYDLGDIVEQALVYVDDEPDLDPNLQIGLYDTSATGSQWAFSVVPGPSVGRGGVIDLITVEDDVSPGIGPPRDRLRFESTRVFTIENRDLTETWSLEVRSVANLTALTSDDVPPLPDTSDPLTFAWDAAFLNYAVHEIGGAGFIEGFAASFRRIPEPSCGMLLILAVIFVPGRRTGDG